MSSILKALRKLEEESAARRDGGITDIARDILRPVRRRRATHWRGPVTVAGTVLLLALGGFSLLPWDSVPSATGFRENPASIVASPTALAPGAGPFTPVREEIVEQSIPAEVPQRFPTPAAAESIKVAATVPDPPAAPAAVAPPGAAIVAPGPAAPAGEAVPAEVAVPAQSVAGSQVVAEGGTVRLDPPLSVESIIFHLQPEARMAVINGLPVMQGTIIEGKKIEEILTDRVRFSQDGRVFETPVKRKGVMSNE